MPADRLAYLRKIWKDILTDPALIEEGKKTQRELDYEAPEKLEVTVRDLLQSLPPDKLEQVNEVLFKKYSS
jgi:hypothetical protein